MAFYEERWGSVMKMKLRQVDREQHMLQCKEKAPLIARIEEEIGWRKLWGDPLDYWKITTVGLQSLSRFIMVREVNRVPAVIRFQTNEPPFSNTL